MSRPATPLALREYVTSAGASPFRDWLDTLDAKVKARVQARVLRFETGNLGDHKSVGAGVWEARLVFGAGYRLYFGKDGQTVVVLLAGGSKASQKHDIGQAQANWREYLEAKRHGKTKQGLERGTGEGPSGSGVRS